MNSETSSIELQTMITQTTDFDLNQAIACPGCDLLLKHLPVAAGEKLSCHRCGEIIKAPKTDSINRSLALALTGLLLFPFAIFVPLMTLDTMGLVNSGNIFTGIIAVWGDGYWLVSIMLALTTMIFPLIKLTLLLVISLNLKLKHYPDSLHQLMRCYIHLDEWGMLEVYMLAIMVTIIKMHHMAHIHYDTGLFCFVGLMAAALGSSIMMDEEEFWELIEKGAQNE